MFPGFIADVHLGRLARVLRMLGFDTLYRNDFSKTVVMELASSEKRTILSKDPIFEKSFKTGSFLKIESDIWMDQVKQVLNSCNLKNEIAPFTRCMVCNGMLVQVTKDKIAAKLEPKTRIYYDEFWQCENCSHIYWKGPHYNRMIKVIQQLEY